MRITAAGTPTITGRLSVATARDLFTDAVSREEWTEHLRAGRAFGRRANAVAVAGALSNMRLTNPAGSGKTLLVYVVAAAPAVAMLMNAGFTTPTGGGTAGRNLRQAGAAATGLVLVGSSAVTIFLSADVFWRAAALANTMARVSDGFVAEVPEAQAIAVEGVTVNTALDGFFFWAEV